MNKLNRHLGYEFIVQDSTGALYVCYMDENQEVHSIDPEDDQFMILPFKYFTRGTEYKCIHKNSNTEMIIEDCYWPSMLECEDSYTNIRKKIQFKDKSGEWYYPNEITVFENELDFLLSDKKRIVKYYNDFNNKA